MEKPQKLISNFEQSAWNLHSVDVSGLYTNIIIGDGTP